MADKSHEGLKWVMRAGYGARGVIYTIVGSLAFIAALKSTQASGTKDALAALRDEPYGVPALLAIGIGLFAYLIWRVVAGIADVDDYGKDAKGIASRITQIITGLLHGGIGGSVISLALTGRNSGGDSTQDWTQKLMAEPMGHLVIGAAGLIMLGAGIYYAAKGVRGSYQDHLASNPFTTGFDPVLKAGLIVYGVLLGLVGLSLGYAAVMADPAEAGGLGQALQNIRSVTFGRILLGVAGLGLLAFALYNFVEAAFRVVPKIDGPDVKTLAKQLAK